MTHSVVSSPIKWNPTDGFLIRYTCASRIQSEVAWIRVLFESGKRESYLRSNRWHFYARAIFVNNKEEEGE